MSRLPWSKICFPQSPSVCLLIGSCLSCQSQSSVRSCSLLVVRGLLVVGGVWSGSCSCSLSVLASRPCMDSMSCLPARNYVACVRLANIQASSALNEPSVTSLYTPDGPVSADACKDVCKDACKDACEDACSNGYNDTDQVCPGLSQGVLGVQSLGHIARGCHKFPCHCFQNSAGEIIYNCSHARAWSVHGKGAVASQGETCEVSLGGGVGQNSPVPNPRDKDPQRPWQSPGEPHAELVRGVGVGAAPTPPGDAQVNLSFPAVVYL